MAGLFATPSLAYGQNEGSCAGRAHPSRLAHASHLSDCPDIPTRSEQADRCAPLRSDDDRRKLLPWAASPHTGSVWPASLGHATFNGMVPILAAFTATSSPIVVYYYLAGDAGILIVVGLATVGIWLAYRFRNRPAGDYGELGRGTGRPAAAGTQGGGC